MSTTHPTGQAMWTALADQYAAIVARAERAEQERDRCRGDAATHRANARGWMKTSEEWQATAEEWEACAEKAEWERDNARHSRDLWLKERDEARARADDAERHRGKWREAATLWEKRAIKAENRLDDLRAAQPRPLTPDAITDEMVKRGVNLGIKGLRPDAGLVRRILMAALTEPPPRPEGAEDLKHPVIQSLAGMNTTRVHGLTQEDIEGLCDRLAERGVRVAGDAS